MTWRDFCCKTIENLADFSSSVTQNDIHAEQQSTVNGMDAWAPRGIAGRGVLIDYHSWAQRNGIEYDRLSGHAITLDSVKTIIKESNIELRVGDIFIIRTGRRYTHLSIQGKHTSRHTKLMVVVMMQALWRHTCNWTKSRELNTAPAMPFPAWVSRRRLRNGCGSNNLQRLLATTLPLNAFVRFFAFLKSRRRSVMSTSS